MGESILDREVVSTDRPNAVRSVDMTEVKILPALWVVHRVQLR